MVNEHPASILAMNLGRPMILHVKVCNITLHYLELLILHFVDMNSYRKNALDPQTEQPLDNEINRPRSQSFTEEHRISRASTGSISLLLLSNNEFKVKSNNLVTLSRLLTSDTVRKDKLRSTDETHFIIKFDNWKTVGFCGTDEVEYNGVVSGADCLTTGLGLSGVRDGRNEPPFRIFSNKNRRYPICVVSGDLECGAY